MEEQSMDSSSWTGLETKFLTQNFMSAITVIDILKSRQNPTRIRNRKIIFQKGFRQLMTFEGLELQEYTDYISLI